jgi:two-component system NtrC family sensor kinase
VDQVAQETNRQLERMSSTLLGRVASLQRESGEVERRLTRLMLTSMLLVVAAAIVVAYFISRRLLRPVRELLTGTGHVMRGDLAYRVPIGEKDEIGELAHSFNAMAEEIQDHRKHLERMVEMKTAELKQAHDSLIQSEKLASIGLLASGVAHELNNPLTSILMNVNLLMEEMEGQPHLHAEMALVNDDVLRCRRIIDDLRDFSRPHELEIQPCNLNEIVKKALALTAHELKLRGITVCEELGFGVDSVPCDQARIQQVLLNVMINAMQAMKQGGTLTVETRIRESLAEIAIQDTGSGIAPDIRGRIFDPFFTTKPEGTGLGLSIVYRIVEEHGGGVTVESATEDESQSKDSRTRGTTVRIVLPAGKLPLNGSGS